MGEQAEKVGHKISEGTKGAAHEAKTFVENIEHLGEEEKQKAREEFNKKQKEEIKEMIASKIHEEISITPTTVEPVNIDRTVVVPISLKPRKEDLKEIYIKPGEAATKHSPKAEAVRRERIKKVVEEHPQLDDFLNTAVISILQEVESEQLSQQDLDRLSRDSFTQLMEEDVVEGLVREIMASEQQVEEEIEDLIDEEDIGDVSDYIEDTQFGPSFNYTRFEEEVEDMLSEAEEEDFEDLTEEEYEQLLAMILGTNERLDTYFKRFEDEEKMDYAMESFKEDVHGLIEKNVTDFGEIKEAMENSLDQIDANQRVTDSSSPFVLRADHHMMPKESF